MSERKFLLTGEYQEILSLGLQIFSVVTGKTYVKILFLARKSSKHRVADDHCDLTKVQI